MKKLFCVIFDVDGTLFDTKPGIIAALNEVLSNHFLPPVEFDEEDMFIGPPIKNSLIKFRGLDEEKAWILTEEYRRIYIESYIGRSQKYAGVDCLIDNLKKKSWISCIATMKTENQIKKMMKEFGGESEFECIKCAKDDGSKTKAEMISELKRKFKNYSLYMIGDTEGDKEAAKEAEVKFIGVTYGYGFKKKDIDPEIHFVDKPMEIFDILLEEEYAD